MGRDVGVPGTWDGVTRAGDPALAVCGAGSLQLPPGPAPKPCVFGAE